MSTNALFLSLLILPSLAATRQCVILDDQLPGQNRQITESLQQALVDAGESPTSIKAQALNDSNGLAEVNLLVLPSARSVPLDAMPAIEHFLQSGGKLIAC